ncbi:atp synthase subunit beta [Senna tora]|uniref:Atp synthase subunit beta n=1 Tax=Senna tora TaxID=362788 RepID=A0A834SDQ4_9FABA|nr:atp synthase subunit beta [Senna tora]KAF7800372.1 atp synthase subunit beta [Senna tora]KAF7800379.1 atp synthase subunit beta [Senna tora]KAF7800388.1 atp synthase subunit beta [Senna tora]KAF7800407.1 atp synthase subunit beta [Senna tora]
MRRRPSAASFLEGLWPLRPRKFEAITGGRRAACVALSPPLGARVLTIASGNPNKNPGAGCAKEMKLTCVASANRRRFLSGAVTKMKLKMTLGNGYLGSRIDEERATRCLGGIWPPVIRALRMAEKGACAGQSPRSTVDEQMPRDRPCVGCPYGWASGEASSAADRAQVPWKGAPERVRAPSCPDPVAPRGAVGESGCLGMQPQSGADGGWRCVPVGCGTALAGLPIGSGCGPMQITAAAQAQAVDMPVETSSSRLWMAARAVWRASAPARSWRRPAGSPFGPIAGARVRVLSGRRGCSVEPRHGIESSKWAIFGKQNWRCGMNRKPGYGAELRANLDPTKGVGRLRQQDGGHGSRNPLRRRGGRCKTWGASPGGAAAGADLGGSSKYSNENFEGRRGERFHVNGTCTWGVRRRRRGPREEFSFLFNSLPTLETAQPEVGSSGWKSTARRVVSGAPPAALENPEDRVPPTPGRTHNRIRSPSPEPVGCRWTARAAPAARAGRRVPAGGRTGNGPFGVPSPGVEQSTQNCETTAKGTGLAESAGKEDPVELDSSPTL